MGKKVSDLTLDDEHMTVGVDDTLQEAAKRLLTISGGIVVVLDDDAKVKGVLGQRQLIKALGDGVDASVAPCHQHMEMDFMQVSLTDSLKGVLADIRQRSPQAVGRHRARLDARSPQAASALDARSPRTTSHRPELHSFTRSSLVENAGIQPAPPRSPSSID